jgi:transposase
VAFQKKSARAAEQDRPDVVLKRRNWRDAQETVDPERLVFVDETGLKTNLTRLRGWAPGGQRLIETLPSGHWQTQTLVHAVALDGTRAAMVLDGPIDGLTFAGFCEHFLAPALRPGDLVVLDNLSSHKTVAAEVAVEATGAKLVYLPPYSPDLNPIEKLFAKLKQLIRGLRPGNWRQIIQAAKQALLGITFDDIENAFLHCGYPAT